MGHYFKKLPKLCRPTVCVCVNVTEFKGRSVSETSK